MDFMFHHAKWEGLHFWDLVQPFFMFIVGVSIPLSNTNRKKKGDTDKAIRNHAFRRAFLLLLFGWGLYCIGPEKIVFQFDNVLAQLSFTYLISFLLLKQSSSVQIGMGFLCILISDLLYRFFPVAGFDQAFVAGKILVLGLIYLFLDTNMVAIGRLLTHFLLQPIRFGVWLQGSGLWKLYHSQKN